MCNMSDFEEDGLQLQKTRPGSTSVSQEHKAETAVATDGDLEKLMDTGEAVLQKNNVTDVNDVRFGFHWPAFHSVEHLHLHVLARASQMGFMSGFKYHLDSYWFITAEQLLQRLDSMD